jgi:hypothetical protein
VVYSPAVEEVARHALVPRTRTGQRQVGASPPARTDANERFAVLAERFHALGQAAPSSFRRTTTLRHGSTQLSTAINPDCRSRFRASARALSSLSSALLGKKITGASCSEAWRSVAAHSVLVRSSA